LSTQGPLETIAELRLLVGVELVLGAEAGDVLLELMQHRLVLLGGHALAELAVDRRALDQHLREGRSEFARFARIEPAQQHSALLEEPRSCRRPSSGWRLTTISCRPLTGTSASRGRHSMLIDTTAGYTSFGLAKKFED
jgi:hypothetical protein